MHKIELKTTSMTRQKEHIKCYIDMYVKWTLTHLERHLRGNKHILKLHARTTQS